MPYTNAVKRSAAPDATSIVMAATATMAIRAAATHWFDDASGYRQQRESQSNKHSDIHDRLLAVAVSIKTAMD